MSLNNHESWKDSSWEFEYEGLLAGQGSEGDVTEQGGQPSPFGDLLGFGVALFESIFGLIRDIFLGAGEFLGGVAGAVGGVLVGAAQAIGGFFGNLLENIFVRKQVPDLEPIEIPSYLNPIQTNLEAVMEPHFAKVNQSLDKSEELGGTITELNDELKRQIEEARESAQSGAITQAGKDMAALNDALSGQITKAREEAEAGAITQAGKDMSALNEALSGQIGSVRTVAETADQKAETADGKAETADGKAAAADQKAGTAQSAAETADKKAATADGKAENADKKAATADSKAETADKKAATADGKAETANGTLGVWNSDNPVSPLWDLQVQINELGNLRDDEQDKAVAANQLAIESLLQTVPRTLFLPSGAAVSDDYIKTSRIGTGNSAKVRVDAVGVNGAPQHWVGQYTFQSVYWTTRGYEPVLDGVYVGLGENRIKDHPAANHNASILTYHVWPGEPDNHEQKMDALNGDSYLVAPQGTAGGGYYTLQDFNFEVKEDSLHELYFRTGWNAATNDDHYGTQVTRIRNGVSSVIGRVNPRTGLGPFWPNGKGYRTQTISESNVPLQKGDQLRFQVFTNASDSGQRYIQKVRVFLSWIAPPEDETT